ncbi:MAG: hypothetical protein K6V97_00270 [Actinomycetia bacterium]|nr:hypothetical protein [Actinomycetes bacterium]
MTEGLQGERIRAALAVVLLTGLGLGTPLVWLKRTVAAEMVVRQEQAARARSRWEAARAQAVALERRLNQLLAAARQAEADRGQAAAQAAALGRRIVATEAAINETVIALDRLTGTPPTNLMPLTANPQPARVAPVALPVLPGAPPPVHTTTGASGRP